MTYGIFYCCVPWDRPEYQIAWYKTSGVPMVNHSALAKNDSWMIFNYIWGDPTEAEYYGGIG